MFGAALQPQRLWHNKLSCGSSHSRFNPNFVAPKGDLCGAQVGFSVGKIPCHGSTWGTCIYVCFLRSGLAPSFMTKPLKKEENVTV